MNIQFKGNYQVFGPDPIAITKNLDGRYKSKTDTVSLATVTALMAFQREVAQSDESYGGYYISDRDVVDFLQSQGLPSVDLTKNRVTLQKEVNALIEKKFNPDKKEINLVGDFQYQLALSKFSLARPVTRKETIDEAGNEV